jgi:hypothetical protein
VHYEDVQPLNSTYKQKWAGKKVRGGSDSFVDQYLISALWSSNDESDESGGEPVDDHFSISDIDQKSIDQAKEVCDDFLDKASEIFTKLDPDGQYGSVLDDAVAHKFWLTRNGHGAGFWDGDYGKELGDALTKLSKEYGEANVMIDWGTENGEPSIDEETGEVDEETGEVDYSNASVYISDPWFFYKNKKASKKAEVDPVTVKDFIQGLENSGISAQQLESYDVQDYLDEGADSSQWVKMQGPNIGMPNMSHRDVSNHKELWRSLNEHSEDILDAGRYDKLVRVFEPDGSLTGAGQALDGIATSLANYPVLNDDEVNSAEYEETLSSIDYEGRNLVKDDAPEDWQSQVFSWLWENNQRALDNSTSEGGSYVDGDDVQEALIALGLLQEDEEEVE